MYGMKNYAAFTAHSLLLKLLVSDLLFVSVTDDLWMTYDDLKSTAVCQFKSSFPVVDAREVHIVMWRSRPVKSDTCSCSVPSVRSTSFSTHPTAIMSVPLTAAVTTSSLPICAPAAGSTGSQSLIVREKFEQQLKEPSDVFSLWPPVIVGAVRQRVLFAFYH